MNDLKIRYTVEVLEETIMRFIFIDVAFNQHSKLKR